MNIYEYIEYLLESFELTNAQASSLIKRIDELAELAFNSGVGNAIKRQVDNDSKDFETFLEEQKRKE